MVGLTHLHASRVSIREQATLVVDMVRSRQRVTFFELISEVKERAVVVARFLSVLELYRLDAIGFSQENPLGELTLIWRSANFDEELLATLGADYDE